MSAVADLVPGALAGSAALMLLVLALRGPVRRAIGPRLGYALWALPAVRLIVPPLPPALLPTLPATAIGAPWMIVGPSQIAGPAASSWPLAALWLAVWLTGAAALLGVHIVRHVRFRQQSLAAATPLGRRGTVAVIATDVDGPLAFGVFRRFVAVPRDFAAAYDLRQQDLALAHECAHHARGDLVANWVSLVVLAAHWWNPLAWVALRAFRDDQEFAVDAAVLAAGDPGARSDYACMLAKAAGLGALPMCNLTTHSNLKGRLMMLAQPTAPKRRTIVAGAAAAALAAAALGATVSVAGAASPLGGQATTIGVKPDGAGGYRLIIGNQSVPAGAPLPGNMTLPADFSLHGGCDLKPSVKPYAMVIKGGGATTTYAVICASATPASVQATLDEGLVSLQTMRASVATQPASAQFPEAERRHALAAIDESIFSVKTTLALPR